MAKAQPALHPAQRFTAPASIEKGAKLSRLIGRTSIALLAESLAPLLPDFDAKGFQRAALRGLGPLGVMQRGAHVANALLPHLPDDFEKLAKVLVAALGPELRATEGNGLAPFFYLPHSYVIALRGTKAPQPALRACHELTRRFTAEFCIRPLLAAHPAECLRVLARWTSDSNPHVRRLVSEGTRPRLPWGLRLKAFQEDPRPALALLEQLKDDPERYVQRSVANHLGDVLKDNPGLAFDVCERWVDEAQASGVSPERAEARLWMVRHAVRLPAKQGHRQALALRRRAER